MSATGAEIHKKILESCKRPFNSASHTTPPIISNDEIEDIIKIVKSLEDSGLLLKGVSKTIQNQAKKQKGGYLRMLAGTLGASLLGNMLAGKGIELEKDLLELAMDLQSKTRIFNTALFLN